MTDLQLAQKYLNKAQSAKDRGIEFDLPFQSFKNIIRAKKCKYTGIPLTKETLTIERVNSKLGYIKGNCVAVSLAANQFKSLFENAAAKTVTVAQAEKILKILRKNECRTIQTSV